MGFVEWLFGRKRRLSGHEGTAVVKGESSGKCHDRLPESNVYLEKDNMGTRHDSFEMAIEYWRTRRLTQEFLGPFALYVFEDSEDARCALLELDCVKEVEDAGNLICTEALIFGYYYQQKDRKWEAIVCGKDLTLELWKSAKESFERHTGEPKSEQEPEGPQSPRPKAQRAKPEEVVFIREEQRESRSGHTMTYRMHKGPSAASARAFLKDNPVSRPLFYIVVETPEGNYGRDIDGIYNE